MSGHPMALLKNIYQNKPVVSWLHDNDGNDKSGDGFWTALTQRTFECWIDVAERPGLSQFVPLSKNAFFVAGLLAAARIWGLKPAQGPTTERTKTPRRSRLKEAFR